MTTSDAALSQHLAEIRRVLQRTQLPACTWCGGALDRPEWQGCSPCVDDYLEGRRRRHQAEQRLQPLADLVDGQP